MARSPPAVGVTSIIRIGVSHAIDDGSQNGDSCIVQLTSGSLDLREPTDIIPCSNHRAVGPAAEDQRIGNRKDWGRVNDDQVIALAELADQLPELGGLE